MVVKVLSGLFHGILCKYLKQAFTKKQTSLADDLNNFDELKEQLYLKRKSSLVKAIL